LSAELKESASESAHRRHIERLRDGAINAIAEAVEGGAPGGVQSLGARASWRLRSVAEVQEAEEQLSDELRQTQAQNAAVLDKLAALKQAMEGTELQHNHHLTGKARYLVKKHARIGAD
jgi:hypothetical protein